MGFSLCRFGYAKNTYSFMEPKQIVKGNRYVCGYWVGHHVGSSYWHCDCGWLRDPLRDEGL